MYSIICMISFYLINFFLIFNSVFVLVSLLKLLYCQNFTPGIPLLIPIILFVQFSLILLKHLILFHINLSLIVYLLLIFPLLSYSGFITIYLIVLSKLLLMVLPLVHLMFLLVSPKFNSWPPPVYYLHK